MKYFYLDIILSFILAAFFTDPRIILVYFGLKLIGNFYLKYLIQGSDLKVIKIYNVVFIIFMSYLGLTHFVNINDPLTDYFYHNDQFVFYSDSIRIGLLDWNEYIDFDPSRMIDPNGRGIAMAKIMNPDGIEYWGKGNVVVYKMPMRNIPIEKKEQKLQSPL